MKYLFSHILIGLFFLNNCNLKKADETLYILDIASLTGSNFKVGGSLTGLTSGSLTLQLNGSESLILSQEGNFEFATIFASGASYEVTVSSQPSSFYCSTANASGTISNASITNLTVTCNAGKRIFVTASNYNGDLTADFGSGVYANGILGADARCNRNLDANKPSTGSYKALITDGTERVACTISNCGSGIGENTDWVLTAETKYIRASDSAPLFVTNSSAIFVFGTMDSPFASMGSVQYWGGFTSSNKWLNSPLDCSNWTTSGAGSNGRVGYSDQTDYTSIRNSNDISCNQNHHLICVEQ